MRSGLPVPHPQPVRFLVDLERDQDGRITVTDFIREQTGITTDVAFVGRGNFFQIWEPAKLAAYGAEVRARLLQLRQGTKPGGQTGERSE